MPSTWKLRGVQATCLVAAILHEQLVWRILAEGAAQNTHVDCDQMMGYMFSKISQQTFPTLKSSNTRNYTDSKGICKEIGFILQVVARWQRIARNLPAQQRGRQNEILHCVEMSTQRHFHRKWALMRHFYKFSLICYSSVSKTALFNLCTDSGTCV